MLNRVLGVLFACVLSAGPLAAQGARATLNGTVVDASGAPQGNVTLVVTSAAGIDRRFVSEPNGRFTFGGLQPGTYRLRVDDERFAPWSNDAVVLAAGDQQTLTITLQPRVAENTTRGMIAGTLIGPDGRPRGDVAVILTNPAGIDRRVASEPTGAYSFGGLQAGTYRIRVEDQAGALPFAVDGVVLAAGERRLVDLRLQPVPPPVPVRPPAPPLGGPPAAGAPGFAPQTGVPLAPSLASSTISLTDAVSSTVERNATLAVDAATVTSLTGNHQMNLGVFDSVFKFSPSVGFTQEQAAPGLVAAQKATRDTVAGIVKNFTALTGLLQSSIRTNQIVPPRCPAGLVITFGGFNFSNPVLAQPINVDRLDPTEQSLLGTNTFLNGTPLGDVLSGVTLGNICTNPAVPGLTADNYFQAIRDIVNSHAVDQSGAQGLNGLLIGTAQIKPENMLLQLNIANSVATKAQLALERLGPLPVDELTRTTGLDISFTKLFRNGVGLTGDYNMQSQDQNFRDKPYDPAFGGLGQPPQFASIASFTLDLPLGRGFGRTAVEAPLKSAQDLLEAGRNTLRHDSTEQAFRTTLAYLNVIGAQETITALQESQARQQRLITLTEQGVQVGDLPRVEIDRARARASRVDSALSSARTQLVAARVSLAETMGIDVASLDAAPTATEKFSTAMPTLPAADALIARALTERRDVRVRQNQISAAETLAAGAQANMKRVYNLSIQGGLYNIYSSDVFRFLPDEQSQNILAPSPQVAPAITYYSPTGFYRALTNRYTPAITVNFQMQLPFGNWAARGRLRESQSSLTSARIDAVDLNRSIRDNVVDVSGQLQRAADAVARWEEAVRNDETTLQAALQLYQIHEITLIDTLSTEETATQDRLQLVSQRQVYLSTLARLKFETGELLTFDTEGPSIQGYKFDPSVFVAR
jgi:outer membrane protein TolC